MVRDKSQEGEMNGRRVEVEGIKKVVRLLRQGRQGGVLKNEVETEGRLKLKDA